MARVVKPSSSSSQPVGELICRLQLDLRRPPVPNSDRRHSEAAEAVRAAGSAARCPSGLGGAIVVSQCRRNRLAGA